MKFKFWFCSSLLLIFSSPVFAATKVVDKIDQYGNGINIYSVSPQDKFYTYLPNKDDNSIFYGYYAFNGKVIGPISLGSGTGQNNPQFSDDGSILMLYGKLQNGESYVYKNGNIVNKIEADDNRAVVVFSNKSGKVVYVDTDKAKNKYNIVIDGKTACSLDKNDPVGSGGGISNVSFDASGKNLFFVYSLENPDFTKQKDVLWEKLRAQYAGQNDELTKQLNGTSLFDHPDIIQAMQDIIKKETEALDKFQKDFQSHSWIRRDVLYKNCQPGESFDEISDSDVVVAGTNAAFFGNIKNNLYLVINGKKQIIDNNFQAEEAPIHMQYRNLSISNDGRRYSYLKQINSNSNKMTVNVDGKMSEVYNIGVNNDGFDNGLGDVLFSADSKHYAYKASIKENNYFVILDGKKSVNFVLSSQDGGGRHVKPLFDDKSNLYYIAKQQNVDCVFVNNKVKECSSGLIDSFEVNAKNGSYYYTDTSLDQKNSFFHIGKKKFGPYYCSVGVQSISPDWTRAVYSACPVENNSNQNTYIDGTDFYKNFGLSTDGGTTIVKIVGFANNNKVIYSINRTNNLDKYYRYTTLREPKHVLYSSNDLELSGDCLGRLGCNLWNDTQVAFHSGYSAIWKFYKKDNALWVEDLKIK
ncbi:MAG: hypothetical protein NT007_07870 [Candidatus Kapabacteria bacterium]|nr:hypothetical protein [Candidatus Kapabacteria bacterium]